METDNSIRKRIALLQTFDPKGVGAIQLQDCLKIQLKEDEDYERLSRICDTMLPEVGSRNYNEIAKKLKTNRETVEDLVRKLEIVIQDLDLSMHNENGVHHQTSSLRLRKI